ncbi:hypothetical protein J7E93_36350, partial [Streptomyces sp. ISL-36]|nr:hypothetical protein [Streptomyces sp. ISL-36]
MAGENRDLGVRGGSGGDPRREPAAPAYPDPTVGGGDGRARTEGGGDRSGAAPAPGVGHPAPAPGVGHPAPPAPA